MTIKKLLLITLLFFSSQLFSQEEQYRVLVDDPTLLNNIGVKLRPFYAELSFGKQADDVQIEEFNASMGSGIELIVDPIPALSKKLGLSFKYRKSYFDVFDIVLETKKIRATNLEIGASWQIFTKTISEKTAVVTEDLGSDGKYSYYKAATDIPVTVLNRLIIDAGIFRTKSPINSYINGLQNYNALVSTTGFYGGLRFSRTKNIHIKARKIKRVDKESARANVYVHCMYAPVINYSNIILPQVGYSVNGPDIKEHLDSNNAIPNLGGRIGLSIDMNPAHLISYSFISEVGLKPPFNGAYIYLGFSANVNFSYWHKLHKK